MAWFESIFSSNFMPHGHCYLWTPGILWSLVVSDALIAASYFSIPVALIYFTSQRSDVPFSGTFRLAALFIITCGMGHLVDIWNVWHGDYWLTASIRIITALASVITAIALWPIIPRALRIPSTATLRNEVEQKERVQKELKETLASLEKRVDDRTAELVNQKDTMRRANNVMVDRELEMIRLKTEVNALRQQLGKPEKYVIVTEKSGH